MMLAQGSFDAFLKARENERSTLLEKITGTQIYKQISCEIYETYNSKKKDIELDENSLGSIELLENEIVVEKTLILNNSKAQKLELDAIEVKLKNVAIWLENLQKLEVDNAKYIQEFEQISFEKESKKEDFIKLEFTNKALNIQPIFQEKNSLLQIINQDKQKPEILQKELENIKQLLQSTTNETISTKDALEKEKNSFDINSKKLQEVRTLQTKIEAKLQSIKEFENKINSQNAEKIKLNEDLQKIEVTQKSIKNELKTIDDYLVSNKNDGLLKEEISLISKNVNDYKELEIQSSNFNKKEQENRDRIRDIEKLIFCIKEHTKLIENISKEKNIIDSSNEEVAILKTNIEEKTKLIDELQILIQTLNEKKEAQLLIAKYEKDRENLKENQECFLCGSKEHPFVNHKIDVNTDETTTLINGKKQKFDEENKNLRKLELDLSVLETNIKNSTLEKDKLSKNIEEIELVFASFNFILEDDSKISLEEEKQTLEEELKNIIKIREEKESILVQKDTFQKELNEKQILVSQKENELYKLKTTREQLESEQIQNMFKKQALEEELTRVYNKYGLPFNETYEHKFKTLLIKKDGFMLNESLKKEFEIKLQNFVLQQTEFETKITAIEKSLKTDEEQLSKLSEETKELQTQSKNILPISDLDNFEKSITNKFNTISEKYNTLSKELVNLTSKDESLTTQIKELILKQNSDKTKIETIKQEFEKALIENGFSSKEEFEKALLPKEQKEELTLMCKNLEEKYTQIQTLKIDTAKKLFEQKELNLTDKELETLNTELKELQTDIDELQIFIGRVEKELEINALNMQKHENKIKELQKKKEAFKVWIKLNEMIGSASGDKFAKFAQGITLEQLIYLANQHLKILTPRYELQKSQDSNKLLEIEICDGFQGDVIRPVSTLSGGESFIVSLSLALGLSSLASQKISIDSLFLDEGFGTLDSDSLELALNALNQLQSSGKMVGVISHVEALKERIPLQIRVMLEGDGTSLLNLN